MFLCDQLASMGGRGHCPIHDAGAFETGPVEGEACHKVRVPDGPAWCAEGGRFNPRCFHRRHVLSRQKASSLIPSFSSSRSSGGMKGA